MDISTILKKYADNPEKQKRYGHEHLGDIRNLAAGPSLEELAKELVRRLEFLDVNPGSLIEHCQQMFQPDLMLIYDKGVTHRTEDRLSHYIGRGGVLQFFKVDLGGTENRRTTVPRASIFVDLDFISVCVDRGRITCLYTREMKMKEKPHTRTKRLQRIRMIMDFELPEGNLNIVGLHYHVLHEDNYVERIDEDA